MILSKFEKKIKIKQINKSVHNYKKINKIFAYITNIYN